MVLKTLYLNKEILSTLSVTDLRKDRIKKSCISDRERFCNMRCLAVFDAAAKLLDLEAVVLLRSDFAVDPLTFRNNYVA